MDSASLTGARQGAPLWDAAHRQQRVQVFGASRAVGRELTAELLRHGHPVGSLQLFGRRQAAFSWGGEQLRVETLPDVPPPAELAFVCTPRDLGRDLVRALLARGTRVVDLSGAAAEDASVPFVVESVNGDEIGAFSEVVALPSRSAMPLGRLLWSLEREVGLEEVDVFAVVAAASEGARGILAVREERAAATAGEEPRESHRRLGNLLPPRGEEGHEIERLVAQDIRRILKRPDLSLDFLAMEGDAERCDAFAVKAKLRGALAPGDAAALFAREPLVLVDRSSAGPAPATCSGSDRVHVGRIRAGSGGARSLCFFAVADQIRAGATSAALRVASRLPAGG